jgi:hypothetical protein
MLFLNATNSTGIRIAHATQNTQSDGPECPASSIFRTGSSRHRIGVAMNVRIHPTGNPTRIAKASDTHVCLPDDMH